MAVTAGRLADLWRQDPEGYPAEVDTLLGFGKDEHGFACIKKDPILRPRQLSILDIGEAFCGRRVLDRLYNRRPGVRGGDVRLAGEAAGDGALGPDQFSSINAWLGTTAGLLGAELLERYTYALQIARELVTWKTGIRIQENKLTRYSIPTTAPTEGIQPGQEFPSGDLTGEFVRAARMVKQAESIGVTWEAAHFDQTDDLIDAAGQLAERFAIIIEERVLKGIFGIVNTYKYNDVPGNTYLTLADAGQYVNKITNELTTEAKSLDLAEQTLLDMKDPATGLEIDIRGDRYIVSAPFKALTAARLAKMTALEVGALSDPDRYMVSPTITGLKPVVSQRIVRLLKATGLTDAQAKERWVYGDTHRAFQYRSAKDITTYRFTIADSPQLARRDLLMELDVSEMGAVTIVEPRACVLNIKDT
jgi:hypothetical protein